MLVTAAAVDRSHLVVRGPARAAAGSGRPTSRRGRALCLLLALALGSGVALWLLFAAFPGAGRGGASDARATTSPAAAPAAVEIVGPATVVASTSCLTQGARDTVAVDGPGGRRLLPLDACGSPVGSRLTARMAFVGAEPAGPPARVLGTGSSAALVDGTPVPPLTGRLAVLLTGVAGLGMAGLLVALARDQARVPARARAGDRAHDPARRPAAGPVGESRGGAAGPHRQ